MALTGGGPPHPRPFLVNAWVDALALGGLSILAYPALKFLSAALRPETLDMIMLGSMVWVVNGVHFSATNYRLYHSRSNISQYPLTAVLVPILVLAGAAAALALPESVAPYYVKLFLLWSPYHYSGQTLGISLIYGRRSGFDFGRRERLALSGFIFGSFVASTARSEAGIRPIDFFGITSPSLGIPVWFAQAALAFMLLCGAAFTVLAMRWSRETGRPVPLMVVLPAAAQFVWFIPGPGLPSYYEMVPFFHGLQYLLIAWFMQLKEREAAVLEPAAGFLTRETLRWGLGNLAGYGLLFYAFPKSLAAASGKPLLFAAPVAIAAVQLHHFFVDGVIWKLRRAPVGEALTGRLA